MDGHMTLGELAAQGPSIRGVLLRHRLDFCCKGKTRLEDACRKRELDLATVLGELEASSKAVEAEEDWQSEPLPALVDHILTRFHEPLPNQLETVIAAAEKVERVHGKKPSCPRGLTAHLRTMRDELGSHLAKEETVLFPAIVAGRAGAALRGPVSVMLHEHDSHGEALTTIRELTTDLQPPPEACATWRALYEQLERLEEELMEHIHLENHVLFPRALESVR